MGVSTITAPDGTQFDITHPDDATDEQIMAYAQQQFAQMHKAPPMPAAPPAPTDHSWLSGLISGIEKPIDNAAVAASHIPVLGPAVDRLSTAMGMPTAAQSATQHQAERANNDRTGFQTAGNIIGTLPTAAVTRNPFVQGALSGAALSDKDTVGGVATDAGLGGVFGTLGNAAFKTAAYAAKPVVSKAGKLLYDAGVPQTLGQIAGQAKGAVPYLINKGEEALTHVPLLGDMINMARDRGVSGLNTALGNRALSNIGEKLAPKTEAGQEMVDYVGNRISQAYQQLVPKLTGKFDDQFTSDLMSAAGETGTLPGERQKQFEAIVRSVLGNRADPGGRTISGQALKDAESRLTYFVNSYKKAPDPDQRMLGDALDQVRQSLRSMVERSNPEHAQQLQRINRGWAQYSVLDKAANSAGNATGVATPAQALSASRSSGFRDPLIRSAKAILPNKTPDSGTTRRFLATMGALGAAGSPAISPWMAPAAAGSLLYTKTGQKLLNQLIFSQRGKALQATGTALRGAARVAPSTIPGLLKYNR